MNISRISIQFYEYFKNIGKYYYILDFIGQSIKIGVFMFKAYFSYIVPCISYAIVTLAFP